jgi:hypothetical protein
MQRNGANEASHRKSSDERDDEPTPSALAFEAIFGRQAFGRLTSNAGVNNSWKPGDAAREEEP